MHFNTFHVSGGRAGGLSDIFFCLQADRPVCWIVLNFFSLTTTLSTIIINSTYRVFLVVRYFLYMVSSATLLFLKKVVKRNKLRISFNWTVMFIIIIIVQLIIFIIIIIKTWYAWSTLHNCKSCWKYGSFICRLCIQESMFLTKSIYFSMQIFVTIRVNSYNLFLIC